MKSIRVKYLLVAVFLFLPTAAYSQGSGSFPVPPVPQSTYEDRLGEPSNFVVTRSMSGSIVGVKEGILTLKTDKNKEFKIALIKETKYKLGKKKIDVAELEESMFSDGRPIKITYRDFKHPRVDKVAVEVRFEEDKGKAGQKPVITS